MGRIMIVDDSRLARTFAAACLRKQGHEVLEVDPTSIFDVLKAVKEARARPADHGLPHAQLPRHQPGPGLPRGSGPRAPCACWC